MSAAQEAVSHGAILRNGIVTYCVVGSEIASESSSSSSKGSRIASSYKLKLLSVCTTLQQTYKQPCTNATMIDINNVTASHC